ncbi:MAG TPA: sensor histidine kinase [Tepidisphaeraceae bacterium]|nr:sensor histidine kinase [Tepidisphaeraceae bacterium]
MRLGAFISANVESILAEWEAFARSVWPKGAAADPEELRDSAAEILQAVAADMGRAQTGHERSEKSMGRGAGGADSDRLDDASEIHGAGRVGSGLTIREMVAEYRALRASVLRLWRASRPAPDDRDLEDVTRFNEAIDQSLARAVGSFTGRLDASRQMFLAILGHDIRGPLAAITLSATLAAGRGPADPELPELMGQVTASAGAISALVADLTDFAATTMGARLPLVPAAADLGAICRDVAREARAARPGADVRVAVRGWSTGTWDAHRVRQVAANLVGNALQHGAAGGAVTVTVDGTAPGEVAVRVHNAGDPIPRDVLPTIFDPLVRGRTAVHARRTPGSIGLGLYIAREAAQAHGGRIAVASTAAAGTTFTVTLPRHAGAAGRV